MILFEDRVSGEGNLHKKYLFSVIILPCFLMKDVEMVRGSHSSQSPTDFETGTMDELERSCFFRVTIRNVRGYLKLFVDRPQTVIPFFTPPQNFR